MPGAASGGSCASTQRAAQRQARVRAYAKLNLGLRVLYKRPDGYHELRTIFQTISLADSLEISCGRASSTLIEMEGAPEIPDNLAERAARLVLEAAGKHAHVRIKLRKNIPTGAGLGGGSSDAAAVLLALPVLAGIRLPVEQLTALAARLGSDVPFFLYGGTALGLGRGEELYPLPDQPTERVLLIAPAVHSSTADAYRDLSSTLPAGSLTNIALQNKLDSFQRLAWEDNKSSIINDFESVVMARHPELAEIPGKLRRAGATRVAMTGSGSAIFGVFDNPGKLERARLGWEKRAASGERAFSVSFVSRSQYQSAWRRSLEDDKKGDETWPPQSRHAR
jgi:4-diphosphocytidyl-2-C-methyl-D-erythritol kinase